jgi:putative nucleotidyltransferase with HDIG domain
MNNDYEKALKKVKPISPSLVKLLDVTADADHSLKEVLGVIRLDSVLTAYVLRAANSAAFRRAQAVESLDMAVSLLGERFVVGMAMDLCSDGFFEQPLTGYESAAGDLWRHSIKTAMAARLVCRYARQPVDSGQAFTGGILHDIGKVVLSSLLAGRTAEMVAFVGTDRDHLSYLDAERDALGADHCEAGVALALQWRLPPCYKEAIAWHHQPARAAAPFASLVYAVHVGDALAMMSGAGTGADSLMYPLDGGVDSVFDFDGDSIPRVLLELEQEYMKLVDSTLER